MSHACDTEMWWKTAVVYCLDVETYADSDGDGVGDLAGLMQRLDHLRDIGVTCLWLMPFYPTAHRDDGYDITDFYGVDPRLGSPGDVVTMVRAARERGIRVIADLVVNHTSADHPWFRSALQGTDSPHRDWYVWRPDDPGDTSEQVMFPDAEDSIWTYDEASGEYYLHRFYHHQPELNVGNPTVREEIAKIIGFWTELGMSGFRVDAVPYLISTTGMDEPAAAHAAPEPHDFLRELREFLSRRQGDAIMLGEVNEPHQEQVHYFGDEGDELDMQFDFVVNQQMYLSLARRDAGPLTRALRDRPQVADRSQWAMFVRSHDELTLDKLDPAERQEVFDAFGPRPEHQLYGRGLRRRLPPMLDGDLRRVKMVYSLMFTLPGTPVLFYGEEIGMGENLEALDRLSVRSPMQWTSGEGGGFSRAAPEDLVSDVVSGRFGPDQVNVADQVDDPASMLSFVARMVRRYRQSPELGRGRAEVLEQPFAHVLAHLVRWDGTAMLALHNLADTEVEVPVRLADDQHLGRLSDLFSGDTVELDEDHSALLTLSGYGYRWLRLATPHDHRLI